MRLVVTWVVAISIEAAIMRRQRGASARTIEHEPHGAVRRRVAVSADGDRDQTLWRGVRLLGLLLSVDQTRKRQGHRSGNNRSAPPVQTRPESLAHGQRQERSETGSILTVLQAPGATVAAKPHQNQATLVAYGSGRASRCGFTCVSTIGLGGGMAAISNAAGVKSNDSSCAIWTASTSAARWAR